MLETDSTYWRDQCHALGILRGEPRLTPAFWFGALLQTVADLRQALVDARPHILIVHHGKPLAGLDAFHASTHENKHAAEAAARTIAREYRALHDHDPIIEITPCPHVDG